MTSLALSRPGKCKYIPHLAVHNLIRTLRNAQVVKSIKFYMVRVHTTPGKSAVLIFISSSLNEKNIFKHPLEKKQCVHEKKMPDAGESSASKKANSSMCLHVHTFHNHQFYSTKMRVHKYVKATKFFLFFWTFFWLHEKGKIMCCKSCCNSVNVYTLSLWRNL